MTQRKKSNDSQRRFDPNRPKQAPVPRGYNVLPAPGILESYEELAPGAAGHIIEMARLEQLQRHKWESDQLKYTVYANKFRQLLAFLLAIIIAYIFIVMVSDGQLFMAVVIAFTGFGYLAAAAITSHTSRKFFRSQKPHEEERSVN